MENDDGWKRELGEHDAPTSRRAPMSRVPVSSGNTHAKTSTNDRHVHPASREELGVHHAHARRPGEPRRRRRRRHRRRLEGVEKKRRRRRAGVRVEFAGRPARSPRRARRRALRRARALCRGHRERVRLPYLLQRFKRQTNLLGEEVAAAQTIVTARERSLTVTLRERARGCQGDVLEVLRGRLRRVGSTRRLSGASQRGKRVKRPSGVRPGPRLSRAGGATGPAAARDGGSLRVWVSGRQTPGAVRALARGGSRPRRPRAGLDVRTELGIGTARF